MIRLAIRAGMGPAGPIAMAANSARSQLHNLNCNMANFMQALAIPDEIECWSLTSLREKLVKIGAKVVTHGSCVVLQTAEVAVPARDIPPYSRLIAELSSRPAVINNEHSLGPSREDALGRMFAGMDRNLAEWAADRITRHPITVFTQPVVDRHANLTPPWRGDRRRILTPPRDFTLAAV